MAEQGAGRHVHMSIGTLSTLLTGYKTAAELAWREKIEGDAAALQCLDRVLLHEVPYISDYI